MGSPGWRLIAWVRSPTGLALAALCGITLAFYHNLWLPGQVLIKRDAFWFFPPLKQYLIERLSVGELPQWLPYEGLGRPFIGTTHTGVFHPFSALYFVFSVPNAHRTATFLSCLLAALGAFVLGRVLNFSRAGALVAGLAFSLSGYVVSLTDNLTYLYSIGMLPLFCATLERALRDDVAWSVAPAIIWATVFLNGDVQTGYYYGFIAIAWAFTRASDFHLETCLRLTLVWGLTALLASIQLGPTWAVFVDSNRAQPTLFHEQVLRWSTHPLRLLSVIASPIGATEDQVDMGRFFFGSPKYGMWAESLYLGVPVTGLACLGAWQRRDLRVLALLGGIALVLALGRYGGLYEIFYHLVPFWSAFRYPEKLMGVVSFAVAMLAGAGLDVLRSGKECSTPWLVAAFLCAAAGLGLHTETFSEWTAASFGAPSALARVLTNSAALAFLFSAIAALGMWLLVAGTKGGQLRMKFFVIALVALVMLDLSRANLGAYHTGPVKAATFTPQFIKTLRAYEGTLGPGRFRLVSTTRSETMWSEDLQRRLGYHGAIAVARRQALDLGHNVEFHIETVDPLLPGYSTALAALLQQNPSMEVDARLNVTYYIDRQFRTEDQRVAKAVVAALPDYDLVLVRNPVAPKPRVYLSQQPERAATPVDPVALIARSDFLNGEVDVIETADVTLPGSALTGSATIDRYAPEDVRVGVETAQPAVLILLDSFDKGWTASLENGTTISILRANALVRAVVVPAGAHVVRFSYQTPLLKAGAWASLTGVFLCFGLLTHARWRTRSSEDRV
ncbi:MAG TPA: YfhO family protein [Candidatus Binatia bacterium]|nr:YfhO family protein [Candidatus Binatia bacterium]